MPVWLALAALVSAASLDGGTDADAGAPARTVLDRIVAIVDRQPVLFSQLDFETRVVFIQLGGTLAATARLSDEDYAAALEWAIIQRLLLAEATRLQVFDVEDAEVAKAVKAFAGRLPGDAYRAFLESREATEEELASILRRDLRVTRFLASKVPFAARVTEPDVRRYWTTHAELAEQPYERVREAIYAQLTRDRYRTLPAARKQLEDLRAKADVRTVTSFAPAPPPPGGDAGTARP